MRMPCKGQKKKYSSLKLAFFLNLTPTNLPFRFRSVPPVYHHYTIPPPERPKRAHNPAKLPGGQEDQLSLQRQSRQRGSPALILKLMFTAVPEITSREPIPFPSYQIHSCEWKQNQANHNPTQDIPPTPIPIAHSMSYAISQKKKNLPSDFPLSYFLATPTPGC